MADFKLPEPEDYVMRSPNVRSQKTGELVELPEGVNKFEYSTPGPHVPTRGGWWDDPNDPTLSKTPLGMLGDLKHAAENEMVNSGSKKEGEISREGFRMQWIQDHGDPYVRDPYIERDTWMRQNRKGLLQHFFGGKILSEDAMNPTQRKAFYDFLETVSKDQLSKAQEQIKNHKDALGHAMGNIDKLLSERKAKQTRLDKLREARSKNEEWNRREGVKQQNKKKYKAWELQAKQDFEDKHGKPKPLTENARVALEERLALWEEEFIKFPTQEGLSPLINFWQNHNPNAATIWYWSSNTDWKGKMDGATKLRLPLNPKTGEQIRMKDVIEYAQAQKPVMTIEEALIDVGILSDEGMLIEHDTVGD